MTRLIYAAVLVLLFGCASQPAPAPQVRIIDTACQWTRLITASPEDTPATKRQILAHDLAWTANCQNK